MRERNARITVRRYRLPPLDLLEAFEAAARHASFTRAAVELSLTQSAVSRQIAALEQRLGVPLFQRLHRALRLSEAGQRLLLVTTEVLRQLHGVTEQLHGMQRQKTVVITTTPGFAGLWLIPRLASFTAQRPDVDVRISASYNVVKLDREGVDLAVRYGPMTGTGDAALKLFGETVRPVCSPALCADRRRPLARLEDLRHHVLLYVGTGDTSPAHDWTLWLRAMKIEALKPAGMLHLSQYDQMIHAAIAGQGIALGSFPLVAQLLKEGRLVAPFKKSVASPLGYQLLRSSTSAQKPEVRDFHTWLLNEARPTAPARGSSSRAGRARV